MPKVEIFAQLELELFKYSLENVGEIKLSLFKGVMNPSPYSMLLANSLGSGGALTAVDVGCGSGILAIVLAKLGLKKVFATDIFQDSINATKANAVTNYISEGVSGTIETLRGSLFKSLKGKEGTLDLIVSNPPTLAATLQIPPYYRAGKDGRQFIDKLILQSPHFLKPNGCLQFSHPFHAGIEKTQQLLKAANFKYEIVAALDLPFHPFHKIHFEYLEKLGMLPDRCLKTQDSQRVVVFRAYQR